jgi:uncharacterized membrane protein
LDSYLILKLVHILSAVVLAGTGIGIAFFMFMANRSRDIHAIAVTARHVVLADWIFTTPAIFLQLVTGIGLMKVMGWSFTSPWFVAVIGLFVFIGACWIPVVFIQYQLREIAKAQLETAVIEARFRQLMQRWTVLGILAFTGIVIMFWLMVIKPLAVT